MRLRARLLAAVALVAIALVALRRRSAEAPVEEAEAPAPPPAELELAAQDALVGRPPRRRRRLRRIVVLALLTLLLAVGGIGGWLYFEARGLVDELHAGPKRPVVEAAKTALHVAPAHPLVVPPPSQPPPQPPTLPVAPARAPTALPQPVPPQPPQPATVENEQTILLVGSDRRWGSQEPGNSDTMLLVRLLPREKSISILSLPRDLLVPIPGFGQGRLNSAFSYGGEHLLIATVRELTGVVIDHFVEVSLRGFGDIVTALGGVYLPVDQRYYNRHDGTEATNYAEIDLEPGYQQLRRVDALAFVRYRHGDNDFFRAARQQLFLREALRETVAAKWHFLKLRRILRAFAGATASDIDSLGEMWRLISALRSTASARIRRQTLPANDVVINGADYVSTTPDVLHEALVRWYEPPQLSRPRPQPPGPHPRRPAPPVDLVPDSGAGRALVAPLGRGERLCAPTALPPGYRWPSTAARAYVLAGHPAIAAYATAGSGSSILWMETTWQDPPILSSPTSTITHDGTEYDLYREGGEIRQIAWRIGPTRAWITNTLRNELTPAQMIALAQSCSPL